MSPIPVEQLRFRGRHGKRPRPGTQADRILAFLREQPDQAWRAIEVARKLRWDVNSVGSVLRRLRVRGLIDELEEHWFALDDAEVAKRQAMLWTNRLADEKLGPERAEDWPLLPPRRRRR